MSKKALTICVAIFCLVCVGLIAWYAIIELYMPEKIISNRKEIDLQIAESGEENPLIEVKYYKNASGDGLEMFEVRWNSFSSESQEDFDTIVFQYVNEDSAMQWEEYINENYTYLYEEHDRALWATITYAYSQSSFKTNGEEYKYVSTDDGYTPLSNDDIDLKERFLRVQIGDSLYMMQPIGLNYDANYITNGGNYYYHRSNFMGDTYYWSYYAKDYEYISHLLFERVQGLASGTSHYYKFEFGDLFNFYEYDEDAASYVGEQITGTNLSKVVEVAETDCVIKIDVTNVGAKTASDSLIGAVRGNQAFNLTGEIETGNYYYGRQVVKLDTLNFDFVQVYQNTYALKLKEEVIAVLEPHKELVVLEITIDLSVFDQLGYSYFGFTEDSGLEDFVVYKVNTINSQGVSQVA